MDKNTIRQLIKANLGNAEDNLHRAKAAFRGLDSEAMKKEHGDSGQTRLAVLEGYQREYDDAARLLAEWDAGK